MTLGYFYSLDPAKGRVAPVYVRENLAEVWNKIENEGHTQIIATSAAGWYVHDRYNTIYR